MTTEDVYGLLLVIAVFFAIRHVICWYFKLNKLVEQQKQIIDLLSSIVKKIDGTPE